jgi:RNA polymerase sigma-70 factor (ECF subfamily)
VLEHDKKHGSDDDAGQETDDLLQGVYDDLRGIAQGWFSRQPADHLLQPTALVHEAYLRLAGREDASWDSRAHFIAAAVRSMRQILVDFARRRGASKRGGGWGRVTLSGAAISPALNIDVLALDEALDELTTLDPRQARIVELRFLGGLSIPETAAVLGISPTTVKLDWRMARAHLQRMLAENPIDAPDAQDAEAAEDTA